MEGSTINERFTTSEAAHFSVHFCRGDISSCQQASVVRPLRVLGRDLCARLNHKLQTNPEILHPFLSFVEIRFHECC